MSPAQVTVAACGFHPLEGKTKMPASMTSAKMHFLGIGLAVVLLLGCGKRPVPHQKTGDYLLFNNRNDPAINTNLHYAKRVDDLHFDYQGEISGVNTAALEGVPSLDSKGNLYFVSTRSYEHTSSTLYRGRFADGSVSGVALVPGVSRQQPGIVNFDAEISGDGSTLYFVDGDFTGEPKPKTAVMVIAEKHGSLFVRDPQSDKILEAVNAEGLNYAPAISSDGLELFFTRVAEITPTAQPMIYRAARKHRNDPFGVPEKVVGITGFVEGPTLSEDGRKLYYHKKEQGHFILYLITRKPTGLSTTTPPNARRPGTTGPISSGRG